jgi:hypothetical protein
MEPVESTNVKPGYLWAMVALAVAIVGSLGSLYLSIGVGLYCKFATYAAANETL